LIALPRGATPLDFAYAVHSDIGRHASGATVNGRKVPIDTRLRNGDEVEIMTSKTHVPTAAWEDFAVTGRARSAIRKIVRERQRFQYIELGRRLVLSEFGRLSKTYDEGQLTRGLSDLKFKSTDDLLAAVGRKELEVQKLMRVLFGDDAGSAAKSKPLRKQRSRLGGRARAQDGWFKLASAIGLSFRTDDSSDPIAGKAAGPITISGVSDNVPVSFAEGGAVPGDRIVGVMIEGRGIRIFHIHSPRLRDYEHEEWIDVTWDLDPDRAERFPAIINVTAPNKPGTLAEIANVIAQAGGNITSITLTDRAIDFAEMKIGLEVWDLPHLTHIVSGLKSKDVVSDVERVFE
jgi:GTP diphosphokinase / guanosine-3',5'-bis(diphosphate) 3'-diphosphatase